MSKRAIVILSLILLICMMAAGCANTLKVENSSLKQELALIEDKNAALEKTVAQMQSKLEQKEQEQTAPAAVGTTLINKNDIYPVYTANINTLEKEIDGYVYMDSSTPFKDKLETLANTLSQLYFSNLPIELIKIEDVDNKKIAVFNLSESKENQGISDPVNYKGDTWSNLFFQGSTGGQITTTRLIETLLQRDYKDQWIDGVRFLYNNGVCDYEHVLALKNICYR